jgi:hypothetical protein
MIAAHESPQTPKTNNVVFTKGQRVPPLRNSGCTSQAGLISSAQSMSTVSLTSEAAENTDLPLAPDLRSESAKSGKRLAAEKIIAAPYQTVAGILELIH